MLQFRQSQILVPVIGQHISSSSASFNQDQPIKARRRLMLISSPWQKLIPLIIDMLLPCYFKSGTEIITTT
ncbi:hypothetical protein FSB76_29925 [Mucilaginibacter ginsenosidivorax]|uniref:Uncharacterized protein n=1 Tax=Mucilaginibacter ginsenosidivorax TaxID=862126 RepID=A0A5B8W7J7_9SPHI|nr:hypothetical protein FSB76_29925 [Mucilaginibacter ginsenosidivorax]